MSIPQFTLIPNRGMLPDEYIAAFDSFIAQFPSIVDAINAFGSALNLATTTTSGSNIAIGTGSKVFTVPAGLGYVPGNPVSMAATASPLNNMFGTVNSYVGTTLTVNVTSVNGSGTFSAWSIALAPAGSGASLGTNTFTGVQNDALGADIASGATVNLTAATGNTVHITGNTTIGAFTLGAGMSRFLLFTGTPLLTHNAGTLYLNNGGGNIQIEAGDKAIAISDGSVVYVHVLPRTFLASSKIQEISAIANTPVNGLTVTINPSTLDFRSSTLSSGAVNKRVIQSATSIIVSSGSTLGMVNNVPARIAVLAIDNSGTIETAVVNLAGGANLDESTLITTVAEGGAGAADSANVIYSTTARSSVPFRVMGYFDLTDSIAGTHVTQPSVIQGSGGQALNSLSSLGYGQTWQTVSRASNTTYYNTTGKPIVFLVTVNQSSVLSVTVNGYDTSQGSPITTPASCRLALSYIIPAGGSYSVNLSSGSWFASELR